MNIFYIHPDPVESARQLADDHIRKMQIESAQMCCTAHWETGSEAPYKRAHKNHPSTIWTRQSIQHYNWLVEHGLEICREFELRYGKRHKTQDVLEWCKNNKPNIPDNGFIEPPKCMPDQFKVEDTIESYKNFYINDKMKVKHLDWKKIPSRKPDWTFEKGMLYLDK
jgi:hypothetical protein